MLKKRKIKGRWGISESVPNKDWRLKKRVENE